MVEVSREQLSRPISAVNRLLNHGPPDDRTDCSVVRQQGKTMLKSGARTRLEEVEALRLAHSLGLPVPAVHESRAKPGDHIEILMDFIEGERLEDIWTTMTAHEQEDVAQQLGQIISVLRSACQSRVRIGACNGLARDCRRRSQYTGGPFVTEAAFNDFLLDLYKATPMPIQHAIRQSLGNDHRIMFTHGDLSPRNIIVRNGRIAALLDWEASGWYPEHWEYVKFFECATDCKGWKDLANTIFDTQYPEELVAYQALVRWQKP